MKKSKNGWELQILANGHLSCDNFDLSSDDADKVEKYISSEFGQLMKNEKIMVGYDNWSGVFIMQMPNFNTDTSDRVIKSIYDFWLNSDS